MFQDEWSCTYKHYMLFVYLSNSKTNIVKLSIKVFLSSVHCASWICIYYLNVSLFVLWPRWFCIHRNLKKRGLKLTIKVLHSCELRRRVDVFIVGIPRQYQERTRAGSGWSVYDLVWPLRHQLPGHLCHEDSATSHQQWGLTTGQYFWIINVNNLIYLLKLPFCTYSRTPINRDWTRSG